MRIISPESSDKSTSFKSFPDMHLDTLKRDMLSQIAAHWLWHFYLEKALKVDWLKKQMK